MSNRSSLWHKAQWHCATDYDRQCLDKQIKRLKAKRKQERQNKRKARK